MKSRQKNKTSLSIDKSLTKKEFIPSIVKKISTQKYGGKKIIEGVQIVEVKNFAGEDGYFMEIARFNKAAGLLQLPEFQTQQISYSSLSPNGIKAWHLHFNQEDVWFVPPDSHVLAGLWDLRKNSPTKDIKMRIVMGKHKSVMLLIPRGVAHGIANLGKEPATLIYFTNQYFNRETPDEHRLPWDCLGKNFWEMSKG